MGFFDAGHGGKIGPWWEKLQAARLPGALHEGERRFLGIEVREMLGDGGGVAWKNEVRPDVGKGLENEAPRGETRVGEFEETFGLGGFPVVEDIDIDDARGISLGPRDSSKVELDGLGGIEKLVRGAGVFDFDDGVVEIRGAIRAGDRGCLIDGRLKKFTTLGREFFQEITGCLEVVQAVSKIGTEGDAGAHFGD